MSLALQLAAYNQSEHNDTKHRSMSAPAALYQKCHNCNHMEPPQISTDNRFFCSTDCYWSFLFMLKARKRAQRERELATAALAPSAHTVPAVKQAASKSILIPKRRLH